ncbi:MAG TPA: serine/threonine-protein kinase, partial [Gemmataceae bacterium]|nr:serine/threonine-protein kinase [Gemmataceae bacterium]
AHAHAQSVIHRDLKPANILVNGEGVPKITDFGLAKRLDSQSTAWTQEGAVLGTASYMPPEQAAGRAGEIGPAADVYALGAILYELLTGRPPFVAETWQQTIDQVLHDEPTLPSRLRPEVPIELETICLKCLEKEPARRYPRAAQLADELDRFLAGQPIQAVPLGPAERLARLAARDGYQLLGEIGRGPHSTVYRALSEAVPQPVAVKVLHSVSCTREQWQTQLQRHVDSWGALTHPHLVPIQRAGWWEGQPYLVMAYSPHGSLADRRGEPRLRIREALGLVAQLAETVSYLHRQGVVHGNLKPSNVLFAADGIPRLGDCRLASGLCHTPGLDDGPQPASLAYLAPELVREPSAEPRPYTDIYGLGLILYELLTGRPPFAAATAAQMLEQVRSQEPLSPSQFNGQVTPDVDALCRRCLDKDPWGRYARMYNVMKRIRHLQDEIR